MSVSGDGGEGSRRGPGDGRLDHSIARNTTLMLLGRVVYVAGWTLIAPYMIHRLGADRFGLWSLLTIISGLYLTFDLGLSSALTKFVAEFRVAQNAEALRAVFTRGAILYGAISAVFAVVVIVCRDPLLAAFRIPPALHDEAAGALVAAGIGYGALNLFMLLSSVLSGLHRIDLWNRISMGVTLAQLAGVFLVLANGGGVRALVINTIVTLLLGSLIAWATVRALEPRIAWDMRAHHAGLWTRLTRYSVALQIVNVGGLVQFQLPKVMFGRFLSLAAVGQYELGWRVASAAWSAPSLLLPPLLPAVSQLHAERDHERVERLYRRAMRYVLALAFPLSAVLIVTAQPLYAAWLGPNNHDAALAAGALAVLMGINILTGPGSVIARGIGRPGYEAEYHVLAMCVHLAMALVLVPRIGFTGGLWALVVSGSCGTLYFLVRLHRALRMPLVPFLATTALRPALAAAATGAVAWLVLGALHPLLSAGRPLALGAVFGAALAGLATAAGVMLLLGHIGLGEVREVLRLVARRAPADAAA